MNHLAMVLATVLAASAWGMVSARAGDIEEEAQAEAIRREQIQAERNDRRGDQQQTRDRRVKDEYDWHVDIERSERDRIEGRLEDDYERLERQRDDVIGREDRQRDLWAEQADREVRQEREHVEWQSEEDRAADGYPWPSDDPRRNAYRQTIEEIRDLEHQIDELVETGRIREADQMEGELEILRTRLEDVTPRPYFFGAPLWPGAGSPGGDKAAEQ